VTDWRDAKNCCGRAWRAIPPGRLPTELWASCWRKPAGSRRPPDIFKKAVTADLQIDWSPNNNRLQCSSGQFEPAISDLYAALKLNPANGLTGSYCAAA